MLALSKIRPSAGTASPASRITISPGTSSSLFFTSIFPPRITFDVAAAISCRASIAFSALLSCRTPSTALMMTTARIMTTSAYDSPSYADVMPEITLRRAGSRSSGLSALRKTAADCSSFFPLPAGWVRVRKAAAQLPPRKVPAPLSVTHQESSNFFQILFHFHPSFLLKTLFCVPVISSHWYTGLFLYRKRPIRTIFVDTDKSCHFIQSQKKCFFFGCWPYSVTYAADYSPYSSSSLPHLPALCNRISLLFFCVLLRIPGSRCIRLRSGRPASGRVPWKCSRSPVRKFPLSFR